ncbi:MAG: NUDIX domain-containing protein [Flavobacteriales bacterium]|nr:NUDIX domain-containing protein [Flavobacteriales bacterium]
MYKVFVNNTPLFLTNQITKETDFQFFLLESVDIEKLITKMYENKIGKVYLYHEDEKQILTKLKEKLPVEKAAGGLVYNDKGQVLFIFRNGKWDIAKGGINKGERTKDAAIREVEEETGVGKLKVEEKLIKTYHIFYRRGKFRLKVTQWYRMTTQYKGGLVAQKEEGIDKVEWVNPEDVQDKLKNSYNNIKLLFE